VVYDKEINDARHCTECACGPPMGSMCTAQIYSYKDAACGAPVDPGYTISSVSEKCIDIQPPGQALGSKSAAPPTYIPGTCEPIQATVSGDRPTPGEAITICCQP
jgi:hypothetical protein